MSRKWQAHTCKLAQVFRVGVNLREPVILEYMLFFVVTQNGTPLVLLGSVGITKALSGTGLKMEQF